MTKDAFSRAEERLGLKLPDSYKSALISRRALWRAARWDFLAPEKLERIEDVYGMNARGVVIAVDEGGDGLVLLAREDEPSMVAAPVYFLDHESHKVRRIAASLDAMYTRRPGPRVSLASLEREAGKKHAPEPSPPSDGSRRIASALEGRGPEASTLISSARGDVRDYLVLVHTRGALSNAYAAWKLGRTEREIEEVVAAILSKLEERP